MQPRPSADTSRPCPSCRFSMLMLLRRFIGPLPGVGGPTPKHWRSARGVRARRRSTASRATRSAAACAGSTARSRSTVEVGEVQVLVEREHLLAVAHAGGRGDQERGRSPGPQSTWSRPCPTEITPSLPRPGVDSIVAGTVDERVGAVAADEPCRRPRPPSSSHPGPRRRGPPGRRLSGERVVAAAAVDQHRRLMADLEVGVGRGLGGVEVHGRGAVVASRCRARLASTESVPRVICTSAVAVARACPRARSPSRRRPRPWRPGRAAP